MTRDEKEREVAAALAADDDAVLRELMGWWASTSEADADAVIPKAIEYSASDLVAIGENIMLFAPHLWAGADAGERHKMALMIGTAFYLHGKLGRVMSALQAGRMPSDDTTHDITVYSMMLRRIQQTGEWVG